MTNKSRNLRDTSKKCKQNNQTSGGEAAKKLADSIWADQNSSINLRQTDSTRETSRVILDTNTISTIHENLTEVEQVSNNEQNKPGIVQAFETGETTAENNATRKISRRRRRVSYKDTADKIINYLKTLKSGNTGTENLAKIACDRTDMVFLGYADSVKKFSLHKQAGIKLQIRKVITQAQLQAPDSKNTTEHLKDIQEYICNLNEKCINKQ